MFLNKFMPKTPFMDPDGKGGDPNGANQQNNGANQQGNQQGNQFG